MVCPTEALVASHRCVTPGRNRAAGNVGYGRSNAVITGVSAFEKSFAVRNLRVAPVFASPIALPPFPVRLAEQASVACMNDAVMSNARPDSMPAEPAVCRFELAPHRSLTPRGARTFIATLGGTTFAVAAFFAVQGFWPVLPFAGMEIGLLIWAVRASMRSGSQREVISITEESITVEWHTPQVDRVSVFPRHWARVKLRAPLAALHPARLVIEASGRACEVGRFLTDDERRGLAVRLKQLVGNVNESPALR